MIGAGGSFAGASDGGIGDNDVASIPGKNILQDPFSTGTLTTRRIDPKTRDYVLGPTSQIQGMSSTQQRVYLALITTLGRSAIATLGNNLRTIEKIGPSFNQQVTSMVNSALSDLISTGAIQIISIEIIKVKTSSEFVHVKWKDMTTGEESTSTI